MDKTSNSTADIVREKWNITLIKEGLDNSTACLISDDIKDQILKEQY